MQLAAEVERLSPFFPARFSLQVSYSSCARGSRSLGLIQALTAAPVLKGEPVPLTAVGVGHQGPRDIPFPWNKKEENTL